MKSQVIQKPGKKIYRNIRFSRRAMMRGALGPYHPHYLNDTSAFRPEIWAQESILTLVESMKYAGTVHTDFNPELAEYGEKVHTREPGEFQAKRKQNDLDNLGTQAVSARKVEVTLNQRVYVSFVLGDRETSLSFKDLVRTYLSPAMTAQARHLDRVVGGQVYQFLANRAGGLGLMSESTASDYMLDARQVLNDNKVGEFGRWLGLASPTETEMQKTDLFKSAERVGDGGRALREAMLGRKHGFDTFLDLNTPSIRGAVELTTTTTTAAASAGATVVNVTSVANIVAGSYITIAGDSTPLRVLSIATLALTLTRPLLRNVANGAVVTPMQTGLVNQSAAIAAGDSTAAVSDGYPAGWIKEIVMDTGTPKVGQLVSFKTSGGTVLTKEYCIIEVDGTSGAWEITLDQPLAAAIDDNAIVCLGPNGDYNFGYQRDCLALVNRSMALPPAGQGVVSASATMDNMSMRVVIGYDMVAQGTRITVDSLFGTAILNVNRGMCLLG